jgi:hypothetical protein
MNVKKLKNLDRNVQVSGADTGAASQEVAEKPAERRRSVGRERRPELGAEGGQNFVAGKPQNELAAAGRLESSCGLITIWAIVYRRNFKTKLKYVYTYYIELLSMPLYTRILSKTTVNFCQKFYNKNLSRIFLDLNGGLFTRTNKNIF